MKKESDEIEKFMPAWYVELRKAYLKQVEDEEKKKKESSKLFS
ncbi:MAG: hypothetical protein WCY41_02900 [Candidatus Micrarchaeia archaeon]